MFALDLTISEIIGRPPINDAIKFPIPTENKSLFKSDTFFSGSSSSTAQIDNNDSIEPTRANIIMYFIDVKVNKALKSGKVITLKKFGGRLIKNLAPRSYLDPFHIYVASPPIPKA